ncbi:hypothetical protein [Micromonospora gifhornensis]|uniref:GIY-YIG domain-containing protein n=1 Tax=Micromonospora gifhornensis TaxID=84594 RepID=A0ABQ4IIC6_9ACTN|nr:hypothetical protein [Micromonospora gifhornensis]GIJ17601.1 hypothetical protein Vgi01_42850 [Micromonospora gifhornensis]
MHDDASPFFIAPHRFDAADDTGPTLDRRHELVPASDEWILGRWQVNVAGHLLGPTESRRTWALPHAVTVTVTDHRLVYVGTGPQLAVVGGRHRRGNSGLVSGQIRWQWPSRLELPPCGLDSPARLLVVCDALRTIQQPALALIGPDAQIAQLSQEIRRAVATFRLTRPELMDLSPPERDALSRLALVAPRPGPARVILPGSLPVEFRSRDDYYRPRTAVQMPYGAASGQR